MTLDEAIIHCEDIVKECNIHLLRFPEQLAYKEKFYDAKSCAEEHRQLVDWLKLLKRILDSGDCNDCGIKKVCQIKPNYGEQVRYNCPLYVKEEDE